MGRKRHQKNPYLSEAMERVLRLMRDEEEDLVREGRRCWVGLHETNAHVLKRLVIFCLVRRDSFCAGLERWHISEDGLACLKDPLYAPKILSYLPRSLRKKMASSR